VQPHPAAELIPPMTDAEFLALVEDIIDHGQREPIVVHEGLILDGRHRFRACQEIGIEPRVVEWDGEGSPEAFVISMNLHRRHLNESQRAMIAARLATRPVGRPTRHENENGEISPISPGALTAAQSAALLNVNRHTVQSAKKVLAEGTAEEIAAIERGDAAVSTVANQIRKGESREARTKKRDTPMALAGKNPERIQRQQMHAEVWGRVKEALIQLTSLPLPSDVASIARSHDRTGLVDARLTKASAWLKEFEHAWSNRDQTAA
jgi:ParB-like chromosome segregation protein Spo0J